MVKGASKKSGIASTLGSRIRMVRKAWGWTQSDLAQALGNDRQIISYWKLDKAKPTRSAMQLLAQTFHIPVEAIATGEGFSIPDLPNGRLDALHHAIRNLLPTVQSGSVQAVDLANGSMSTMTLREAKAVLDRSHKEGLTVWVVASPGTPR